jgi:hypothetical protein
MGHEKFTGRKLQEIAARDLGGAPEDYDTSDGRVFRRSNPAQGLSFAQAATRAIELGGRYSGEELAPELNDMTKASATALAGQGLVAAAKDNYPHSGSVRSFVVGFAEVELDVEAGALEIIQYTAMADCGTMLHPRSLGAQILGGSIQGMGIARSQKWVYDPVWGVSFAKRLYTARPPGILDVPVDIQWGAVEVPDPQTPVGARESESRPWVQARRPLPQPFLMRWGGNACAGRHSQRMCSWLSWRAGRRRIHRSKCTSDRNASLILAQTSETPIGADPRWSTRTTIRETSPSRQRCGERISPAR